MMSAGIAPPVATQRRRARRLPLNSRSSGAASRSDHGIDAATRYRPRTVTGDD